MSTNYLSLLANVDYLGVALGLPFISSFSSSSPLRTIDADILYKLFKFYLTQTISYVF